MKKTLFICASALLFAGITTSCDPDNKKNEDEKVDPSTIASSNLIAYFPFDGNGNDIKGNMTPDNANNTVTYVAGQRGQAYQGSDAITSGLLYNLSENSPIRTLQSFSFSMWIKMVANTIETGNPPEQMIFHLDGTGDWIWGNLFFLQHRNYPENADAWNYMAAPMDVYFWREDAATWKGQRADGWKIDLSTPKWRHIICTYDAGTSEFHGYVDGTHIVSHTLGVDTTIYKGVNRWQGPAVEGTSQVPFGACKFTNPEHFVIGHWADKLREASLVSDAWAAPFKGNLDEFRIYNKGLSATEVDALYKAELSQLDE